MPIYEYKCRGCGERFEHLHRGEETPVCPACGGRELEKQMSVPSAPQMAGGHGSACSTPCGERSCPPSGGCGGCPCARH